MGRGRIGQPDLPPPADRIAVTIFRVPHNWQSPRSRRTTPIQARRRAARLALHGASSPDVAATQLSHAAAPPRFARWASTRSVIATSILPLFICETNGRPISSTSKGPPALGRPTDRHADKPHLRNPAENVWTLRTSVRLTPVMWRAKRQAPGPREANGWRWPLFMLGYSANARHNWLRHLPRIT